MLSAMLLLFKTIIFLKTITIALKPTVLSDRALVDQMRADVEAAEIHLSYTEILLSFRCASRVLVLLTMAT